MYHAFRGDSVSDLLNHTLSHLYSLHSIHSNIWVICRIFVADIFVEEKKETGDKQTLYTEKIKTKHFGCSDKISRKYSHQTRLGLVWSGAGRGQDRFQEMTRGMERHSGLAGGHCESRKKEEIWICTVGKHRRVYKKKYGKCLNSKVVWGKAMPYKALW